MLIIPGEQKNVLLKSEILSQYNYIHFLKHKNLIPFELLYISKLLRQVIQLNI